MGFSSSSPEHKRKREREYYAANKARFKERQRADHLRQTYGLTPEDYEAMLREQQDGCAICGTESWAQKHGVLVVDHDHEEGTVRGLLCDACNLALGKMQDSPSRLRAAADYLEKSRG